MLNYAAGVDERDLERYSNCFAQDIEIVGFGSDTFTDRDEWLSYVWKALDNYNATQHMLGPMHATIDGDTATTRSDVQAFHQLADGSGQFTLWATYHTQMRRLEGRWKIVRHELIAAATRSD